MTRRNQIVKKCQNCLRRLHAIKDKSVEGIKVSNRLKLLVFKNITMSSHCQIKWIINVVKTKDEFTLNSLIHMAINTGFSQIDNALNDALIVMMNDARIQGCGWVVGV